MKNNFKALFYTKVSIYLYYWYFFINNVIELIGYLTKKVDYYETFNILIDLFYKIISTLFIVFNIYNYYKNKKRR